MVYLLREDLKESYNILVDYSALFDHSKLNGYHESGLDSGFNRARFNENTFKELDREDYIIIISLRNSFNYNYFDKSDIFINDIIIME